MLKNGLYELLISDEIRNELDQSSEIVQTCLLRPEAAGQILAQYIFELIQKIFSHLEDNQVSLSEKIEAANEIILFLHEKFSAVIKESDLIAKPASLLLSLINPKNSPLALNPELAVARPELSLAKAALFTGQKPVLESELQKEISSADSIDLLISFIKWSGLQLLMEPLRKFVSKGKKLRVITTTYMQASDFAAIEALAKLPNTQIKISYETAQSRLHAKAYLFTRDSGFSSAYIGSSNLSKAAMTFGQEWNLKLAQKEQPELVSTIQKSFEDYWKDPVFELYNPQDPMQKERLKKALAKEKSLELAPAKALEPFPFQKEILDALEKERNICFYRNLVVAATGTGKTMIAAFDYKRYLEQHPQKPGRLLFIAHRQEILEQSQRAFQTVLNDYNFGEVLTGKTKIKEDREFDIDHLFLSIQSFNSKKFHELTSKDYYDYIVIDEFHHAAAKSYQRLLHHYHPEILLGLTATPERLDGKDIQSYFDHRIAAEIRLPEAIERKFLSPFRYFGLSDPIALDHVAWKQGSYDVAELSRLYLKHGLFEQRADWILDSLARYVPDLDSIKGLAFCVSVDYAKKLADYFTERGLASLALSGKSKESERTKAKEKLLQGKIKFIFVVDLYNEGVDIPEINTILFLRPTQSLTIFLQQLGRGLRLSESKEYVTVLDFIGQSDQRYNFEEKFQALLEISHTNTVSKQIEANTFDLPYGCFITLEEKAREIILENIRQAYHPGNVLQMQQAILRMKQESDLALTISNFLDFYDLDPALVYKNGRSFKELAARAQNSQEIIEPIQKEVSKNLYKLTKIDSRRFLDFLLGEFFPHLLEKLAAGKMRLEALSLSEQRMVKMLFVTLFSRSEWKNWKEKFQDLEDSVQIKEEITALLGWIRKRIGEKEELVDPSLPLEIGKSYSMDQVGACFDMNMQMKQSGVFYFKEANVDVFFNTLEKDPDQFKESLRYQDYFMDESHFHWQSQSSTRQQSEQGKRYISDTSTKYLFVRREKEDRLGKTSLYHFIGKLKPLSYWDEKPISFVWQIIPALSPALQSDFNIEREDEKN